MLERGRSLSGHERHCAFLNTGKTRFADVSAASGLDLLDDGRGVALVDWDFDGRVDMWTTNRTAPWVRLLHNRSDNDHHFLAVKLQGTTCNRDAIGARLKLRLGGTQPRKLHKSVRAGEGFVAQSSKWIVFGLGSADVVDHLEVHWPGGFRERFENLAVDQFHQVTQGKLKARRWDPPAAPQLKGNPEPPRSSEQSRIFLATRIPLPPTTYLGLDGKSHELLQQNQRPTLVQLWASWCGPCMKELRSWSNASSQLENVDVVTLNVDGMDSKNQLSSDDVTAILERIGSPFRAGLASKETLEALEASTASQIDKPQPLVVPSSILLDSQGRIAIIYRGPAEVAQIRSDVALIDGTPIQLRDRAAHFSGRWFDSPPPSDPSVLLRTLVSAGQTETAEKYLDKWASEAEDARPLLESFYLVADANRLLGREDQAIELYRKALQLNEQQSRVQLDLALALLRTGKAADATEHFEAALRANPGDRDTRKLLVLALTQAKHFAEMEQQARRLVADNPQDAIARLHLAYALKNQQKYAESLKEYRQVLKQDQSQIAAQNDLAWLLATCPDETIRDGAEALRIALRVSNATGGRVPPILDTLAAAQAASGDFAAAVETVNRAIEIDQSGPARLTEQLQKRLKLYESKQPFIEYADQL